MEIGGNMFFTIQVTRKNGQVAKQLFDFADEKTAKSNHYYFLASSCADAEIDYILAEVVNDEGICICRELYKEEEDEGTVK